MMQHGPSSISNSSSLSNASDESKVVDHDLESAVHSPFDSMDMNFTAQSDSNDENGITGQNEEQQTTRISKVSGKTTHSKRVTLPDVADVGDVGAPQQHVHSITDSVPLPGYFRDRPTFASYFKQELVRTTKEDDSIKKLAKPILTQLTTEKMLFAHSTFDRIKRAPP